MHINGSRASNNSDAQNTYEKGFIAVKFVSFSKIKAAFPINSTGFQQGINYCSFLMTKTSLSAQLSGAKQIFGRIKVISASCFHCSPRPSLGFVHCNVHLLCTRGAFSVQELEMLCKEGICTFFIFCVVFYNPELWGWTGLFLLWEASFGVNWLDVRMLAHISY